MKLLCSRQSLLEGINVVQKVISSRTPMPILDGVLIEANEQLCLTGYDLETGIECRMEADIEEPGMIVMNVRILGDIIRRLPSDLVSLKMDSNYVVTITSGASEFNIRGLRADDYPKIPVVENTKLLEIEQGILKEMIRQTQFAASTDESRPILNGINVISSNKTLELVAIDGFRLAVRQERLEDDVPDLQFIVPVKAMNEVARVLEPSEGPVKIYPSHNHILFDTGNIKVVSRLIQGEFMKYESILPNTAESTVTVETSDLLDAVERASLVVNIDDRRFPICFKLEEKNMMTIRATAELGDAYEEILVESDGTDFDIDFNQKYFIDALRVITDEK